MGSRGASDNARICQLGRLSELCLSWLRRLQEAVMKIAVVAAVLLSSGLAMATGVGDPVVGTSVLWTIPGVIHTPTLATAVMCTNTNPTSSFPFRVEFFDNNGGGSQGSSNATLLPGTSVIIATHGNDQTQSFQAISATESVVVSAIMYGSARVLSTSKFVMCTAF